MKRKFQMKQQEMFCSGLLSWTMHGYFNNYIFYICQIKYRPWSMLLRTLTLVFWLSKPIQTQTSETHQKCWEMLQLEED